MRSGFHPDANGKCSCRPRISAFCTPPTEVSLGLHQTPRGNRYLVGLKNVGCEAQISGGKLRISGLDRNYRNLRFRRQVAPDASTLELVSGQSLVSIVIQFSSDRDSRNALADSVIACSRFHRLRRWRAPRCGDEFPVPSSASAPT